MGLAGRINRRRNLGLKEEKRKKKKRIKRKKGTPPRQEARESPARHRDGRMLRESLFADRGCLGILISFPIHSNSGLHRGFMNSFHLPFPGHGLQGSLYQGVWTFPRSLFSSLEFVLLWWLVSSFFPISNPLI